MKVRHLNPGGLPKSPVFSQGVLVPAAARMLIVGGQNGVDENGQLVSASLGEQSAKAIDNLLTVLASAGGKIEDLVRLAIYVKGDVDLRPGLEAWMRRWGQRANPPAIVVLRVAGMARPDALVEVEATAVLD